MGLDPNVSHSRYGNYRHRFMYFDILILAAIASFRAQTLDIHNWLCHDTEKGMGELKKKYKGHPLHHFGQGSEKKFM